MNDRYSAYRAPAPGGPYVVTPTLTAILSQLRRVSWSVWETECYTQDHYQTRQLGALTDAQARAFLAWLQAQPTANPQWHAEATP